MTISHGALLFAQAYLPRNLHDSSTVSAVMKYWQELDYQTFCLWYLNATVTFFNLVNRLFLFYSTCSCQAVLKINLPCLDAEGWFA